MSSSDRVRFARNSLKLSQQKFADALGISRGYLSDVELGHTEPSYRFVKSLLKVYSININWIIEGKGDMFIEQVQEKDSDNFVDIEALEKNLALAIDRCMRDLVKKVRNTNDVQCKSNQVCLKDASNPEK